MEANFNLGSLKIVYDPLMEYFKTIQSNVNENLSLVENKKSVTNYDFINVIGKIQSSLKVIGLFSLVEIFSMIEEVIILEKENKISSNERVNVWKKSSKFLKDIDSYIKQLLESGVDQPLKLFPQYKELADLINKPVTLKNLFFPKIDLTDKVLRKNLRNGIMLNNENKNTLLSNIDKVLDLTKENVQLIIDSLSQNLEDINVKNKVHGACKHIYEALSELQEQKISRQYYVAFALHKALVCIFSPISNENYKEVVSLNNYSVEKELENIIVVISQLKEQVKKLKENEKTGSLKPNEEIIKDLIYILINIDKNFDNIKNMPVFKDLNTLLNYSFYKNELIDASLNLKNDSLLVESPDNLRKIEKLMLEIKEEFSLLTTKNISQVYFSQYINNFNDLMNKLNSYVDNKNIVITNFINSILFSSEKIKNKDINFNDDNQKEMSLAVVLLEYTLPLFFKNQFTKDEKVEFEEQILIQTNRLNSMLKGESTEALPLPQIGKKNKEFEQRKSLVKVYEEINREIKVAEEVFDNILRNEDHEEEDFKIALKSLKSISGVLSVLSHPELSQIVKEIDIIWNKINSDGINSVEQKDLNFSIDSISGLTLFVEAFLNNNMSQTEELEDKLIESFNKYKNNTNIESIKHIIIEDIINKNDNREQNIVESEEIKTKDLLQELDSLTQDKTENNFNVSSDDTKESEIEENELAKKALESLVKEEPVSESIEIENNETVDLEINNNLLPEDIKVDTAQEEELLEVFLEEMASVEEDLKSSIEKLDINLNDEASLINIRRSFHTIKGSGRMIGLSNIGEVAWTVEHELTSFIEKKEQLDNEKLNVIKSTVDKFIGWKHELFNERKILVNVQKEISEFVNAFNKQTSAKNDVVTSNKVIEEKTSLEDNVISVTPVTIEEELEKENISLNVQEVLHELPINEENIQSTVEDSLINFKNTDKETVNINGVEVSSSVFKLFNEESSQHLQALRKFVHDGKNLRKVLLTEDVMRHSHTLSSIGKSVNLLRFSTIAAHLEDIANISIEKQRVLSRAEMVVFRHAVDSLDIFTSVNIDENIENLYEEVKLNLEELYQELNNDTIISQNQSQKTFTQEDVNKIIFEVKLGFDKSIEKMFEEKFSTLEEQFKKELTEKKPVVDLEEVISNMSKKLESTIDNKFKEAIKDKESDGNKRISQLETRLEEVKTSQNEGISAIKSDIRKLGHILKKKSSYGSEGVDGNEINDSHSVISEHPYIQSLYEEKISSIKDELDIDVYENIVKEEISDIFNNLDSFIENINSDITDEDISIFKRDLHTFKGSVKMAGANRMGTIAHRLESLLDYMEKRDLDVKVFENLFSKEIEKLKFLSHPNNLYSILSVEDANWLDDNQNNLVSEEEMLLNEMIKEPLQKDVSVIRKEDKQVIRVDSNLLDNFINDVGEVKLSSTTLDGTVSGMKKNLSDFKNISIKLSKNFKQIELQADSQISNIKDTTEVGKNFDPLEFDRYNALQELVRSITENIEDINDVVQNMENALRTQENSLAQQSILLNSNLDNLMKVRLLPIENISDKFFKLVGRTAKETNKRVSLEIIGEKTEVDRLVLDRVQIPLEHLIRNSIAHGIETPEEREKLGKEEKGLITLECYVETNFIIFKVKDDGQGINLEKVKKIGIEKGLLDPNKEYNEEDIINLIFTPGFSTSSSVSQVSGRGVGMDIVKNEIISLSGSIKTSTIKGVGTTFTITLPVAVATNQASLITVGNKLVAIPAILINQVVSLKKNALIDAYNNRIVSYKEKDYPLYYLGHLYGTLPPSAFPEIKNYNTLLIISYLDKEIALHIDNLQTTEEILIKPLGNQLNKISGFLGGTLLGDGRQGIVINPLLLKEHFIDKVENNETFKFIRKNETKDLVNKPLVMVVDDSTTVRRATQKVLEKNGFSVILAKDGANALELLQLNIPNIILSDIEMPVMDGFEFLKNVRTTEKYKKIPVIMITSRTAAKHKSLAYELGVDNYLGKPYQEDELINSINELLKR